MLLAPGRIKCDRVKSCSLFACHQSRVRIPLLSRLVVLIVLAVPTAACRDGVVFASEHMSSNASDSSDNFDDLLLQNVSSIAPKVRPPNVQKELDEA
eukprot:988805-Pleurochrysis_carterae.AAC.1